MPAQPSDEEIAYVAARLAQYVLEQAALNTRGLHQSARDWFAGHDEFDHRAIAAKLATGLADHAVLVAQRRAKMTASGKMVEASALSEQRTRPDGH